MHIHRENRRRENCPSLSLIPSVCLRQLAITKATHCCRGKPWGRTHRENGEDLERKSAKRETAINEEERKHRFDHRLSVSPSVLTGEGRDDE